MKKGIFILTALLYSLQMASASPADPKYKVADIPKHLLTDAKAVIRKSETTFEVTGINKAVLRKTYAITILNQNGLNYSIFAEGYGKFISVKKIEWDIFDQNGLPVKLSTDVEVEDYSAIAGYSLYEDTRVKYVDPKYRTTPFTIEYSYEIAYNGLFFMPEWTPYEGFNTSVEKSSFTVTAPLGYKLRYLERFLTSPLRKSETKEKVVYEWSVENMTAIRDELFGLPLSEFTPSVNVAPSDFEIDGFAGNMNTWESFGKWMNALNSGRDELTPETVGKVKQLISGKSTDFEKIEALYKYMQDKVRYVNIVVGIGGWQTIPAETVDRLSYGDCKALSNYMMSLLKAAGIKSYFTLVYAGSGGSYTLPGFPSNQFNHVILCVPIKNDTVWLECTSQHNPTGFLGRFTDDRHVLLNTPEGGKLVKTRAYDAEDNIQSRKIIINVSTDGNATANATTRYGGVFYDDIIPIVLADIADRKKALQRSINIKSFDVLNFNHSEIRKIVPAVDESLELKVNGYGAIIGNRMLINPNLMTKNGSVPSRTKERKSGIRILRENVRIDTVTVKLPLGYKADALPENITINSKFGEYSARFISGTNEITYVRRLLMKKGDYPATDFNDFTTFLESISTADEKKVPLVKVI